MKDKIVHLMKSEGLSSSRLAEILEIQPSGVSHLVSGRNKPGFDLLQKILKRFPHINPDWLLLDDEEIYRPTQEELPATIVNVTPPSNESPVASAVSTVDLFTSPDPLAPTTAPSLQTPIEEEPHNNKSSKIDFSSPRIKRVIILYDDDTCESYTVK